MIRRIAGPLTVVVWSLTNNQNVSCFVPSARSPEFVSKSRASSLPSDTLSLAVKYNLPPAILREVRPKSRSLFDFRLYAGGFEWEDPGRFDQDVENPFKNPALLDGDDLKVDPARLLGPRLNGANVYFIGMMGSGKSAVGNLVARRMGSYNFLDTDEIIEKAAGITIPEIFAAEGEDGFREVEAQILDSCHAYVRMVISTGGGIVMRLQNWSKLQTGLVVWLDVPPEVIYERIRGDGNRPLLQTANPLATLTKLLDERRSKYEQADVRVEVTADMDADAVADAVVKALHDFIDDHPPAYKLAKQKAQADGLDWVQ